VWKPGALIYTGDSEPEPVAERAILIALKLSLAETAEATADAL
jgi:hypothetical protein